MPKKVKGDALGLINTRFVAKYQKKMKGRPFGAIKNVAKKSYSNEKITT